jgi:hypothetical protein
LSAEHSNPSDVPTITSRLPTATLVNDWPSSACRIDSHFPSDLSTINNPMRVAMYKIVDT